MSKCKTCGNGGDFMPKVAKKVSSYQNPNTKEDHKTTVVRATDFPVWNESGDPDAANIVLITEDGLGYLYPLERLTANGNSSSLQYRQYSPANSIEVPVGQVVPIYVEVGEPHTVGKAQANEDGNLAATLAIANDIEDDYLIVQGSGVVVFPRVHKYQVGKWYYLSQTEAGAVVSVKPESGKVQPLFYVLDQVSIQLNIGA